MKICKDWWFIISENKSSNCSILIFQSKSFFLFSSKCFFIRALVNILGRMLSAKLSQLDLRMIYESLVANVRPGSEIWFQSDIDLLRFHEFNQSVTAVSVQHALNRAT